MVPRMSAAFALSYIISLFKFFYVLRQGLAKLSRLGLYWRPSCLRLLSVGITGVYPYTQLQ